VRGDRHPHVTDQSAEFLSGVIEGFYGKPWTASERIELFDWMARWGLNTYFYAPKDDLHHRALWREPYAHADARELAEMIEACGQRRIRFVYALSPGLDIRYSDSAEIDRICGRFEQLQASGGEHFSLLFDDIPGDLAPEEVGRWGSLAAAQCHVANAVFRWTRGRAPGSRFIFCPTAYCGRMAANTLGGPGYLETVGSELLPGIDIFWTGPNIVSREITAEHVQELQGVLKRKPLIWDNLHANDYDGRRFFCGPYSGRLPELRQHVAGLLSNPNNEFPLNYMPLRSLAAFTHGNGVWEPRDSYLAAIREWLPSFATVGPPVTLDDLILFCDCFYLPHEEGNEAIAFYECARRLVADQASPQDAVTFKEQAKRLRDMCDRITELRYRPIFHALSRRIWDLREGLDLVERYVTFKSAQREQRAVAEFRLPVPKHPGMVARLHQLVVQDASKAGTGVVR
jgi:protein O-GlcNAcase / histone acetyltransferase